MNPGVPTHGGGERCRTRELARRAGREVKRIHEDVAVLSELGLVKRSKSDAYFVLLPIFAGYALMSALFIRPDPFAQVLVKPSLPSLAGSTQLREHVIIQPDRHD